RARRQLFLCYPVMAREGAFAGVMQRLSRFVAELPERLYTAVTVRRKGWADADSADRWMDGDSPWDE
ncbi:MAG: hypothetical protein HYY18_14110, partial [Planctomycetes bacterium]|nr:hypothetical protein [Planctomycetota bacterium]